MGYLIGLVSLGFDKLRMEYVWWCNRRANRKRFDKWQRSMEKKRSASVKED
jgi:hypothetical protein